MSFESLLNQTITIYNKASTDKWGRKTVGSGTSVSARLKEATDTFLLPNGEVQIVDGVAYVDAGTTVSVDDKISYNSIDYRVLKKEVQVDGAGTNHHIKLILIKWTD
jgi:hypothetical protein